MTSPSTLLCPHCGYNVSYTTTPRCPECGTPFDPEKIASSQIPWTHRKTLGKPKAYLRTLRLFCRKPRQAALEIAHPPLYPDANSFRWTSILLASILYAVALLALLPAMNLEKNTINIGVDPSHGGAYQHTLLFPFFALTDRTIFVIILFISIYFALHTTSGYLRLWFWLFGGERKKRASTLACYLTGWFPIIALMVATNLMCAAYVEPHSSAVLFVIIPGVLLEFFFLLFPVAAFLSTLTLFCRTTGASFPITFLTAFTLPLGIALISLLSFLSTDYLAGLLALIFSSLFSH